MTHRFRNELLGYPALAWLIAFFLGPLVLIFAMAFAQRGEYGGLNWSFSTGAWARAAHPIFLEILARSFGWALFTTAVCLVIGFPMAWAMVTRSRSTRNLLLLFIALPFLMNLIIRVYAIRLFFGFDGPAVHLSSALGLGIDPFAFSQNIYLVVYGMVTSYLPFMLFPLYVGLEKFDFQLIEASNDLGCSPAGSLFKIVIPNATRPMINGCILVFIPSLGEFVIPDLLGGAKTMLAGNLITEQFLKARDWPFGSVLALCLIAFLLLALWGFHRIERGVHARARTP